MREVVRIPVDVTKVCTGMFVTMLDRPWLETPFVFQGFEIRDRLEIEQLQQYCSFVYVDVERSRLSASELVALQAAGKKGKFPTRPAHAAPQAPQTWLQKLAARCGLGAFLDTREGGAADRPYPVSSTVRGEAPAAHRAYEDGVARARQVRQQAATEGRIDADAVRAIVDPVVDSILRNPDAMAWTVFSKKRSDRHYSRALATSVWCIMFGRHLGFERKEIVDLGIGGLLLDIGNVRLPDNLVDAPGAITEADYEQVTQHVSAGLELLHASGGFSDRVLEMVRCHHERNDGSGYPDGLRGNRIPTFGRIAAVADCYDAMTTKTPYSPALAAYDAARELNGMRNQAFQSEVIEQFLQMIGMFPTGSVVELSDGSVGVVLEQNRIHPLRPKVMLLLEKDGEAYSEPQVVNLADAVQDSEAAHDRGAGRETADPVWIEKGHEHGAFGIDPQRFFNRAADAGPAIRARGEEAIVALPDEVEVTERRATGT